MQTETQPYIYKYFVRILILIIVVSVAAVCFNYFITWATWDYESYFLQADACLDEGGVWDKTYEGGRCWYAGQCEDMDGFWYPAENRCVLEGTTASNVL